MGWWLEGRGIEQRGKKDSWTTEWYCRGEGNIRELNGNGKNKLSEIKYKMK